MARSFSNVKLFSTFAVDGISNAILRRGYAMASQRVVSNGVKEAAPSKNIAVLKRTGEEIAEAVKDNVSWVPNPVTGFYRPENCVNDICPTELRVVLLKKN